MMIKKFFALALVGSFLTSGLSFAEEEETPLSEKMGEVSGALKGLRRAGDDYAKCVALVQEAQAATLECFPFTPALLEKMPEGKEKSTALANYRKTLAAAYQALCDLELAFLSEDQEKIDEATDAVKKSRSDGHDVYIEED